MMRGQVFNVGGKSIFTFGGTGSHDIDGGILEPIEPTAAVQPVRKFFRAGCSFFRR